MAQFTLTLLIINIKQTRLNLRTHV